MNLLGLRYFLAVAEYSSFTKASEHIYVTQPTLSRQIMDLEEELGASLFLRGKQALTLTTAGARFLPEAREILKRCDNLRAVVKQDDEGGGPVAGVLKLGYQGFLDTTLMQQTVKSLTAKYPRVDFSLFRGNPPELNHDLLTGKCDAVFGLKICVASVPDLECLELEKNELLVAVPAGHRLAKHDSVDMRELANESFILLERKVSPFTVDYAISLCMKNGFSPNASHYVDDAEKALLLVDAGKGVCFLHSRNSLQRADTNFEVKTLRIEGSEGDFDFVLAFKKGNSHPLLPLFISELLNRQDVLA